MHLLNAELQASCFEASFICLGFIFQLEICFYQIVEIFLLSDLLIGLMILSLMHFFYIFYLLVNLMLLWEISLNKQHHP
jgi:hypothetical protein